MKAIQLPKLAPKWRFLISLGLILMGIFCWLNAIIIGLVLVALLPALFNTLAILPLRAVVIFVLYFVLICSWIAIGWMFMRMMVHIRKQKPLAASYIVTSILILVILETCELALKSSLISMIAL